MINVCITIINDMMIKSNHNSQKPQYCYWKERSGILSELIEVGCSNILMYQWFKKKKCVYLVHISLNTWWLEFRSMDDAGIILASNSSASLENNLL